MKIKQLHVLTEQGLAGALTRESQFVFNYLSTDPHQEVSLLMPLREQSYAKNTLPNVFRQNLPEGYLLDVIQRRLARHMHVDDMQLLRLTGERQIGRLIFREPTSPARNPRAGVDLETLLTATQSKALFEMLVSDFLDAGISGMQPKVLLDEAHDEKTTLILPGLIAKAAGSDYPHLTANEFLCMSAAKEADMDVPEFWLSNDQGLFVMRRFDRFHGRQLGFEDMAVLSNQTPDSAGQYKYRGSYEAVARIIQSFSGNELDGLKFFEYVTLSCMVRNGDAHLKNFGMLYDDPSQRHTVRLAPLYDVVTTTIYRGYDPILDRSTADQTMALKLGGKRTYPDRATLLDFGRTACGVLDPEPVLERIGRAMLTTLNQHGNRFPDDLMAPLREAWQCGLSSYEISAEPDAPRPA